MTKGIGTDIEKVLRVKNAIEKGNFLTRFFTEKENLYFRSKKNPDESVTGCFCAKEATAKALGTGFRDFSLKDIEILHDKLGKPYVLLHNKALEIFESMGAESVMLSISHTREEAVAFVIIE